MNVKFKFLLKVLLGLTFVGILFLYTTLLATGYQKSLINQYLLFAILALSFDILRGNTGYINLAHSSVFGWSAYFFAMLVKNGHNIYASTVLASFLSLAMSFAIGFPFFRVRGAYYTIITLGFSLLSYSLIYSLDWLTGGWEGITINFGDMYLTAFYILFILIMTTIATYHTISKSSFGLALRTMREDEIAAESYGLNTYNLKLKALTISSIFPAVAGPIYVLYNNHVNPDTLFGLKNIFAPATMTLFGGSGTLVGPLIGSLVINSAYELLFFSQLPIRLTIIGLLLMMVGLFMPTGITGILKSKRGAKYI